MRRAITAAVVFGVGFFAGYGATFMVVGPVERPQFNIVLTAVNHLDVEGYVPPLVSGPKDPPWLTEEEMRASWLGLPEPRQTTAQDLGITEASASWESWHHYWSECYESVFCWMESPEPPIPIGPESPECIARGEGGACNWVQIEGAHGAFWAVVPMPLMPEP